MQHSMPYTRPYPPLCLPPFVFFVFFVFFVDVKKRLDEPAGSIDDQRQTHVECALRMTRIAAHRQQYAVSAAHPHPVRHPLFQRAAANVLT